jgi:hypothetical protein
MAPAAQRLQVASIVRPTAMQRRDVIDLRCNGDLASSSAHTAQRLGKQDRTTKANP